MKIKLLQDTDALYTEFRAPSIAGSRDPDENTLHGLDAWGNI